jgi:molybdopterin synthase sulfur carrier subunit
MVKDLNTLFCQKPRTDSKKFIDEIIHALTYLRYNRSKKQEQVLVRVEFLGPIQKEPLELNITNLNELATILQDDKDMQEWLENSAVAVNDTLVNSKDIELKDGDKVSLLPPVCGG